MLRRIFSNPCRGLRAFAGAMAMAVAVLAAAAGAIAHPKPGAHADVRITIEDEGVRFDVLMNALFADGITSVQRAARDAVREEEEAPLCAAVGEYFGVARPPGTATALVGRPNTVRIDGIEVTPVVRELKIVRPLPETRPGFVQNPALLIPQIHAVMEYPAKAAPKSVGMVWGVFPRDFLAPDRDGAPYADIEAVVTGAGHFELITLTHAEPEFVWRRPVGGRDENFRPVPPLRAAPARAGSPLLAVAVLCAWGAWAAWCWRPRLGPVLRIAGAGAVAAGLAAFVWLRPLTLPLGPPPPPPLARGEALEAFSALHANIYRAFDYTKESEIYDALARSVDGPLLDAVYNDVYRGLVMQEEGGALSRVKSVTPVATEVRSIGLEPDGRTPAFEVEARWRVVGVVYHWGHSHARTNEYAAVYGVASRSGGWRIVSSTPLQQQRIEGPEQAGSAASLAAPANSGAPAPSGPNAAPREEPRP